MRIGAIFNAGGTQASQHAAAALQKAGLTVLRAPCETVTHILLDVPSFSADGTLRSGGDLNTLLQQLPESVTVIGGKLLHPALAGYKTIDLLEDPEYLAENAAITAHCAVKVALQALSVALHRCPVLIIGWGRIGKCLAQLLRAMGAEVTVAARKETDRAMLRALGYTAVDMQQLPQALPACRLLFNTAPEPVLSKKQLSVCPPQCVKIELASKNGLEGEDVIIARGLPGVHAPESSGALIANTILRLIS